MYIKQTFHFTILPLQIHDPPHILKTNVNDDFE